MWGFRRAAPAMDSPRGLYPVLLGVANTAAALETADAKEAGPAAILPMLPAACLRDNDEATTPSATFAGRSRTPAAIALRRTVRRRHMILDHAEDAQQLHDVYELEESILGVGCFGAVRRAWLRSAPSVVRAVKAVQKRCLRTERAVRQEISVLKRLDHPRICRLLETFEDDGAIYLVLEYIEGRELFDEIIEEGQLDEPRAAFIMSQIFGALRYCHNLTTPCFHRDLKPENIMVQRGPLHSEPEVKLIDFGLAVITTRKSPWGHAGSSVAGTAEYMAPETRKGKYLPASDIWSVGMILHSLLVGGLPARMEALVGDEALDFDSQEYAVLSPMARDLLRGLLRPRHSERLTAAEASGHCWVQGVVATGDVRPREFASTIRALTAFHRSERLRRAALTAVGMQLSGQQLEDLRQQFLLIDSDGNGRISKDEFVHALSMAACGGENCGCDEDTTDWVDAIFDAVDTDGSQEIEFTEWLAAALQEGAYRSDQAISAAFRCFDLDGDGFIDAKELEQVLAQTADEVAAVLPRFDCNGDGVIDFSEFKRMLTEVRIL
eukprot:CAMPEP_0117508652 /NCGR_PEP_ID=MMETSP0784-20121206/27061_1 /TAXON_ID=39447 /ORGANISM="" /LENGTH=551 /DNA_ID=CAMNT_0005304217 /DNA_START=23 /DNA_END=1678 /DNA_ORIENTATION=+